MNNPITALRNYLAKPVAVNAYDRGFYEGGKVTKANQDFWNANSDFETTAVGDRDRIRARARWLSGNNAIMDNIDNAIINNTVGKGIMFQSITGKAKFDADVEERFMRWCKNKNLCDARGQHTFSILQRLIIKTRLVDGEIFIYKKVTKLGLEIQLLEAESLDAGRADGGIELDGLGKIINYHFKDAKGKAIVIKSQHIINYFMPERASQYRGISEYKQAIIDIKNFSAFQTASIQGARARANIAYAVKQNGKTDPYGGNMKDKTQSINGVNVMYLGVGEDISKLDPDSVATDYVQFSENTIRLIATARKVSYELAFRDYSKVNFASSRASLLQDNKRFDVEQDHFVDTVLTDIYTTWLEVEILKGTVKASGFEKDPFKWIKPKWIMPKRDLVDPLKEITALEKKINLNLTCETDVANSDGEDYEEILKKKAHEIELKAKYGIPDYTLIEDTADTTDDGETNLDENITGSESSNNTGGNDAKK
jgi:lambda family phage portal protein